MSVRGLYKLQCPVQCKGVLFPGSMVTRLVLRGQELLGLLTILSPTVLTCALCGNCGVCKRLI